MRAAVLRLRRRGRGDVARRGAPACPHALPWQGPSSAAVPPHGAPGGSGRPGSPRQGRDRPLGAPRHCLWCSSMPPPEWPTPTPRVLLMAVQAQRECRNIYFTPLVHSMYALHLRRWLRIFPREPCSMVKRAVLAEAELPLAARRRPRSRARDALRLQSRAVAAQGLQRRFGAPPRRHESSCSTAELVVHPGPFCCCASTTWCCSRCSRCSNSPPSCASRRSRPTSRSRWVL